MRCPIGAVGKAGTTRNPGLRQRVVLAAITANSLTREGQPRMSLLEDKRIAEKATGWRRPEGL
jgi:hypothetical protein